MSDASLRLAVVALSLSALAGCTTTQRPIADDEAIYLARWNAQQTAAVAGGGLASYEPLETARGAVGAQPLARASGSVDESALDAARAYVAARASSAFIVWHRGAIVEESYFGQTDAATLINAKSLAKPLTAIVIGRAIALGHVRSLDQPVADFITEWKDDPRRSRILVRHLLDMRSGLAPQAIPRGPEDPMSRAYLHPRHDEIIINEYPLVHEPGARYDYANVNSELVAPLIERATGERYADFVGRRVLAPIGAAGGEVWVNRPGGTAHAGCCIQIPAQSWLRLAVLLAQDGVWGEHRLLPEGYVRQMRTGTPQNPHAGLGVWLGSPYLERRGSLNPDGIPPELKSSLTYHSEPYAADDLFLFDGNGNQVIYIVPSLELVVLRTGTFPGADKGWDNAMLPNLVIRGLVKAGPK